MPSPPLRCPSCRGLDAEGTFIAHPLRLEALGWRCTGCGLVYPSNAEIPVLVRHAEQLDTPNLFIAPPTAWCERLSAAEPDDLMVRESKLLTLYALAHHPEAAPSTFVRESMRDQGRLGSTLKAWLSSHPPPDGDALELGCGLGGHAAIWKEAVSGTLTLSDLRHGMLVAARALHRDGSITLPWHHMARRYSALNIQAPGPRLKDIHYVVADATDPPFDAEHFSLVVALNLIDSCRDPWMLLGQIDALTKPGGLIILGQPFHYERHAQHPEGWFEHPEALLHALSGGLQGLEHLDYTLLEQRDEIPWSLPAHDRLVHRYAMHLLIAKKRHR